MNPDPDREQDPQLAALYRAGADAAPPAHLDDAIRAAARREVAAGPRRAGIRRWAVPVSLAAVLLLSVSVVTLMREQGADRSESMLQPPVHAPIAGMQSEIAKRESAEPPTAVTQDAAPKRRSAAPPPAAAPAAPLAQAGAPAPAPAPALSGRVAEAEQGATESRAKAMAAESSNRAEAPLAARRDYAAPQPIQRSAPPPLADAAGGAGASASKPAAAALSVAPAKGALWQDLVQEPPEKWIQRITELRRDGKTADADALLAEFRRRFPDARLPGDLR